MGMTVEHWVLSEEDYLVAEEAASFKNEYLAGEAYAMAEASEWHNRISGNIFFHLRAATRGHRCRTFAADMKLRITAHRAYYYPDVMLVCDPADNHPIYKTSPCFIAEVLSPNTAAIDQREKWLHYRDLPGLRYYLLADSDKREARFFSRDGDVWREQTLGPEDIVEIACDGLALPLSLDDLYEDTGLS